MSKESLAIYASIFVVIIIIFLLIKTKNRKKKRKLFSEAVSGVWSNEHLLKDGIVKDQITLSLNVFMDPDDGNLNGMLRSSYHETQREMTLAGTSESHHLNIVVSHTEANGSTHKAIVKIAVSRSRMHWNLESGDQSLFPLRTDLMKIKSAPLPGQLISDDHFS